MLFLLNLLLRGGVVNSKAVLELFVVLFHPLLVVFLSLSNHLHLLMVVDKLALNLILLKRHLLILFPY